jgi:antigen flippase
MSSAARAPANAALRAHWPAVRAMSITGSAALLSGLLSAAAVKILATAGGPAAVATLTTLQQIRQAGVVAATANGQTALVQGSSALSGVKQTEYVRTVAVVFCAMTGVVAAGMLAGRYPLAAMTVIGIAGSGMIAWLAPAVILSSTAVFFGALLNTLRGVGRLAVLSIVSSAAMALGAWPAAHALAHGQRNALAMLLVFSAGVSGGGAAVALVQYRSQLTVWCTGPGRWWSARDARSFGAMSAATFASGLISSGALLAVRGHIASTDGLAVTGQFDAAWALSMNQVTLVLSSLQTHYLPAVARSRSAAERDAHISSVLTVSALTAASVIAGIALLKPWLLTLFYSSAFRPAAIYLRWTLVGDYLKVTSWVLSIPMLAAADMKVFLAADVAAYAVFVAVGVGLANAGAGFVAMYAVHLLLCAIYLRRRLGFAPTLGAVAAFGSGLCLVISVSALTWRQT